jgi:hypothetical protein
MLIGITQIERPARLLALNDLCHEHVGFELVGTGDGDYKGKKFEWLIYIK